MTLAVAYIRQLPERMDRQELIFASDSRLSGGQRLDFGKKLFGLARSDVLLGFAGDCDYAYPCISHVQASIETYPRSIDRRFPISKAKGQILKVFNQLYQSIHGFPNNRSTSLEDSPKVQFLFGGYSWHVKKFRYWYIDIDRESQTFRCRRCNQFHFIGDRDAVGYAKRRTNELLRSRNKAPSSMDLEPIEALLEVIGNSQFSSVGGAVQIAKAYEHMNTQFFSSQSINEQGTPCEFVFGRQLLPYENCSWPVFDTSALKFSPNKPRNTVGLSKE